MIPCSNRTGQPPPPGPGSGSGSATPATATVFGVVALVLTALTATLTGLTHQLTVQSVVTGVPIPLVYGGVGVIVARHQPGNPAAG